MNEPNETQSRRLALQAELAELDAAEAEQGSAADVAVEVVAAVAPAVADVVIAAGPQGEAAPDPIDQAAAVSMIVETESAARIAEIQATAAAEIAIVEARGRVDAGIVETIAENAPELDELTEPEPLDLGDSDSDPAPPRKFIKGWFG